jgi:hypothetical protein
MNADRCELGSIVSSPLLSDATAKSPLFPRILNNANLFYVSL